MRPREVLDRRQAVTNKRADVVLRRRGLRGRRPAGSFLVSRAGSRPLGRLALLARPELDAGVQYSFAELRLLVGGPSLAASWSREGLGGAAVRLSVAELRCWPRQPGKLPCPPTIFRHAADPKVAVPLSLSDVHHAVALRMRRSALAPLPQLRRGAVHLRARLFSGLFATPLSPRDRS